MGGRGFGRQERRRRRAANGRREVRPARPCHMNIARTHVHLSLLPWQVCTRLLMHDCSSDGCSSDNCSSGAAAARTLAGCSCDTAARPMWLAYATCVAAARGRRDDYSCDGCSCDGCSPDGCSSDAARGCICVCASYSYFASVTIYRQMCSLTHVIYAH